MVTEKNTMPRSGDKTKIGSWHKSDYKQQEVNKDQTSLQHLSLEDEVLSSKYNILHEDFLGF